MNRFYLWNFYPPFLGAGIRITYVHPEFKLLEAKLTLHWWNKNYIGTAFGGSIYSLCDPFHMILLIKRLEGHFIVRDKGAEIAFLKKGIGTLTARFEATDELVSDILHNKEDVHERKFHVDVFDSDKNIIAKVTKTLHFRRVHSSN